MSNFQGASITLEAEFKNLSYRSNPNGTDVYDGKIRGNVFLDSIEDYTPTRKPCTVLWISDREFCSPDYEGNVTRDFQAFVWSYFLVIVQDTREENSWRRIGLERASQRRGLFNDSGRGAFKLV